MRSTMRWGRAVGHVRPMDRAMAAHVAWLAREFGRREFSPLSPADIAALSLTLRALHVEAGRRILSAGQPAEAAYIVERGEVELFIRRGARRMLIGIQGPGGVFGDVPLLCDEPVPFNATARTDTVLLEVGRAHLTELLAAHPAIALRWLTSVVKRLERAHRRVVELAMGDLRSRTLALLAHELAGRGAGDLEFRLTQEELAALLGARRQSVNKILRRLAGEGLIRQRYGQLDVVDPARILELAGERTRVGAC